MITTKIEAGIYKALANADIALLKTRLHERQAYKAIFVRRQALAELDNTINGLDGARENAERLASEVIDLLTELPTDRTVKHVHA